MSKLLLPSAVLQKMICLKCKNYLSYFPIQTKKDGTGAICGRCRADEDDKFIRDDAYEGLAQFLLFPCVYKGNGCKEAMVPSKLEKHEQCCLFRKFSCPNKNFSNCAWMGPRSELVNHYTEKHPNCMLKEPNFSLNFLASSEENLLFQFQEQLFVVRKEVDSRKNVFLCSVQHLKAKEDAGPYHYYIKVESGDENYFKKYPERSTDGVDVIKLAAQDLREQLHDPETILVNVEICEGNVIAVEGDKDKGVQDIKKDPNINWDILSELECPICFDYMLPPIYQCLKGHSICEFCKVRIAECPLCKKEIQTTQNFSLEKMTQHLTYPCKFYKTGCNFSAKSLQIRDHEEQCEFGPYECPLKEVAMCAWKNNCSEVVAHIDGEHNNFILKNDTIDVVLNKEENAEHTYIIKFNNQVFRFMYRYAGGKFCWACQLVGRAGECKKYRFEIDVIDYTANKRRCYFTGPVGPLTQEIDAFKNAKNCLALAYESVEPFIEDRFAYKMRIFKD